MYRQQYLTAEGLALEAVGLDNFSSIQEAMVANHEDYDLPFLLREEAKDELEIILNGNKPSLQTHLKIAQSEGRHISSGDLDSVTFERKSAVLWLLSKGYNTEAYRVCQNLPDNELNSYPFNKVKRDIREISFNTLALIGRFLSSNGRFSFNSSGKTNFSSFAKKITEDLPISSSDHIRKGIQHANKRIFHSAPKIIPNVRESLLFQTVKPAINILCETHEELKLQDGSYDISAIKSKLLQLAHSDNGDLYIIRNTLNSLEELLQ